MLEDSGTIHDEDVAEDLGALPDSTFIVYKHVKYSLKNIFYSRGNTFTTQDLVQIGVELFESVENIHSTGYIHLDIKPDNILVSERNEIVLIDYGCARKFELEDGTHLPNTWERENGNSHFASLNAFKN